MGLGHGLVNYKVQAPDLFDHGGNDHEDEGRHGGEGGHGGLGEAELDHGHDQEVEVGHPAELLQGVDQPEGEDVVLGALDEVVAETELEIKTWKKMLTLKMLSRHLNVINVFWWKG